MTFARVVEGLASDCVLLLREGLCTLADVPTLWPARIRFLLEETARQKELIADLQDEAAAGRARAPARGRRADDVIREMEARSAARNKAMARKG